MPSTTMNDKSVLVTGATGLLGRQVVAAFEQRDWTAKGTGLSRADGTTILKVDLKDGAQIERCLDQTRPQVVVHCAANRFPDKVDQDPEGTRALNVAASQTLARLCAARSVLLIFISTDYVMSGRPGEAPYEADAPTEPTNLYGRTKQEGELAVLGEFRTAGKQGLGVVLRVPVLYGPAESPAESAVNVLMDIVQEAQQPGEKIKMDHWALRYPTNTEDVARVCHDDVSALPVVLQFSSEDKYTKYGICELFAREIMGLPMGRIEANTEGNHPGASVLRPFDCHLSTRELKDLGIDVSTQSFLAWWRREVKAYRK